MSLLSIHAALWPQMSESGPIPAATILLVRDGEAGLEVFMVRRHHEIEFAAGAVVFPGGKASAEDFDPALGELGDGMDAWSAELRGLGVTAIREAFEEAGVLLAREAKTGEFVGEQRLNTLDSYRHRIETGELSLLEMLRRERLRLACDELVHFAHWITPKHMPKRFDTHFFLARAPLGHEGQHCGRESIDSLWIFPDDAIANRNELKLMFPTRLNLMKLACAKSVDEALASARAAPPVAVEPWTVATPEGKYIRIRDDAGYELTSIPLREAM